MSGLWPGPSFWQTAKILRGQSSERCHTILKISLIEKKNLKHICNKNVLALVNYIKYRCYWQWLLEFVLDLPISVLNLKSNTNVAINKNSSGCFKFCGREFDFLSVCWYLISWAARFFQFGFLYVEEHRIDYNPEVSKQPEMVIFRNKKQSFEGNYSIEFIKTVNKVKIYLFLNIPENENDRDFRKELVKTVIDCNKFFNGVYANPFVKYAVHSALSSAQFELKMPMKPVTFFLQLMTKS